MEENQIEQTEQVEETVVEQAPDATAKIAELQRQIASQGEELRQTRIKYAIEDAGLKDFVEFIHIEDESKLDETVAKFKGLIDGIKAQAKQEAGYIPADHRQDDEYSTYEKKKDVQGMLGTKLANLFK